MFTTGLSKPISRIVCECSDSVLMNIIDHIDKGVLTPQSGIPQWTKIVAPFTIPVPWIADLTVEWKKGDYSTDVVLQGFYSAMETKKLMGAKTPAIELAWTGPQTSQLGMVRTNYSLLVDMIGKAEREILLLGYSFTPNERTENILGALSLAKSKGCAVKVILHDNGSNHLNFLRCWPSRIHKPLMLKWIGNVGDGLASMHAKVLVIDNRELLVTSANLTYHGMGSNIELGVRVSGEVALKVSRHLFSLEQAGELVKYRGVE